MSGITTANLTDTGKGGNTFTITGWTGSGTLKGTSETLVDSVPASVVLTKTSLAVTGGPTLTLSGFTTANLTDTAGGNTFTVSGWTGSGSLTDSAAIGRHRDGEQERRLHADQHLAVLYRRHDAWLERHHDRQPRRHQRGKTFTVSGWTGSGSLTDTATGIVTASKNAGFTLTNTSLISTDGMALALSGITTANLTDTSRAATLSPSPAGPGRAR